jgi:hypothetical protein
MTSDPILLDRIRPGASGGLGTSADQRTHRRTWRWIRPQSSSDTRRAAGPTRFTLSSRSRSARSTAIGVWRRPCLPGSRVRPSRRAEALLALRAMAGETVSLRLVSASDRLVLPALSVAEPFALGEAPSNSLERLAAHARAESVKGLLALEGDRRDPMAQADRLVRLTSSSSADLNSSSIRNP